ncbi:peroxidase [Dinoroseobacter shibae DFL 12 = DSM 16493]|jgi:Dyp-type peroxidase family|uniref:Peroxidase n=1 Tax=Dinoroseobacter shibae (strain DSM 16493 / NCIMB 14021 / DFL 12) TaxID=398580 RepID=A8LJG2_DINSH|nr:Dyp-type peroxidase domain-containing protein [Dinoroseobacter shibae]ABV93184.1 peroxidase [Dinoroseobacter shibae DFL 12 = DSM 16493]URF48109.1 Dyp-type peroxidase [Dinoroseobacter shibae]URF52419.1 Dyp-type peroxidase [Dinoroseobacter shibae]
MIYPDLSNSPNIQGIFFRGYVKLDHTAYGMFRVTDRLAFQDWLSKLLKADGITSAAERQPDAGVVNRMNIAFTAAGLKALLQDGFMGESYDHSFTGGMVAPERSRILGDVEVNAPQTWDWGCHDDIHGVLMSFAPSREVAETRLRDCLSANNGAECTHVTFGRLEHTQHEPFGFKDGISQPVLDGTPRAKKLRTERPDEARVSIVPPGELILGYADSTGALPETPATSAGLDPLGILPPHPEWSERRDFGKDGSYLVLRTLKQDTDAFWNYCNDAATGEGEDTPIALAEKMVGRRINGDAMAPNATPEDNNSFDFTDDRDGKHCPIGSHVRRSNNRAVNIQSADVSLDVTMRHRILRRARIYEDAGETGLQFICFNASIVRQFEFMQSAWCNNAFFQGLQKEVDPIIGTHRQAAFGLDAIDRYTIPRSPYRRVLKKLPQFVTVKGGAYFFMPSLAALRFVAQSCRAEQALKTPLNTPGTA